MNSLRDIPVPDINQVDSGRVISIAEAVDNLSKRFSEDLDNEIDREICDLYGFSASERVEILVIH